MAQQRQQGPHPWEVCKSGDRCTNTQCTYVHYQGFNWPSTSAPPRTHHRVCKFDAQRKCNKGDACSYVHYQPRPNSQHPASSGAGRSSGARLPTAGMYIPPSDEPLTRPATQRTPPSAPAPARAPNPPSAQQAAPSAAGQVKQPPPSPNELCRFQGRCNNTSCTYVHFAGFQWPGSADAAAGQQAPRTHPAVCRYGAACRDQGSTCTRTHPEPTQQGGSSSALVVVRSKLFGTSMYNRLR